MRPNEEQMLAYLHGNVSPDERAAIDAYLAASAEGRAALDALKSEITLLSRAFETPMREPAPARLETLIRKASAPTAAIIPLRPASALPPRPPAKAPSSLKRYALPIAAALALTIGALGGYMTRLADPPAYPTTEIAIGTVPASSPLASVLENESSGTITPATLNGAARRLSVVATFKDKGARFCREFEVLALSTDHAPLSAGVACRAATGGWGVEGIARIGMVDGSSGRYQPSGANERDALDGLLSMLGTGTTLPPVDEQAAITNGWRQ